MAIQKLWRSPFADIYLILFFSSRLGAAELHMKGHPSYCNKAQTEGSIHDGMCCHCCACVCVCVCQHGQCIACLFLLKSTRSPSALPLSFHYGGRSETAVSVHFYCATTLSPRLGCGLQTESHMQVSTAHLFMLWAALCAELSSSCCCYTY